MFVKFIVRPSLVRLAVIELEYRRTKVCVENIEEMQLIKDYDSEMHLFPLMIYNQHPAQTFMCFFLSNYQFSSLTAKLKRDKNELVILIVINVEFKM